MQHHSPENTNPDIEWRDGDIPVSRRFKDPYFSLEDGLAETRHVFLAGNDLPARFRDGFHVAELGFGTGLNFLATVFAWQQSGTKGRLHYTGFEAFPLSQAAMGRALAAFPSLADQAQALVSHWPVNGTAELLPGITLQLIQGDARKTLPSWSGRANAWYLDGFAPARNPELWEPALLARIARASAPGATVATYSAAGAVRRALADAGFQVDRVPGYGRKRHMTRARLPG